MLKCVKLVGNYLTEVQDKLKREDFCSIHVRRKTSIGGRILFLRQIKTNNELKVVIAGGEQRFCVLMLSQLIMNPFLKDRIFFRLADQKLNLHGFASTYF